MCQKIVLLGPVRKSEIRANKPRTVGNQKREGGREPGKKEKKRKTRRQL